MAGVDLYTAVKMTDEALKISLPVKPRYAVIGYGLTVLLLPVLFITDLIARLRSNAEIFWPVAGLMLLAIGAVIAVGVSEIAWLVIGREEITISSDSIQISHVFAGLSYTKHFTAAVVDGVYVSREPFPRFALYRDWEWRNFHRGRVALNSGRSWLGVRTYRFGEVLTPSEAHWLVDQILDCYPQYRYHAD